MRTIRIKLYKFDELSKAAKTTAIEDYRQRAQFDYVYEDAFETVKKFANVFNIKVNDFDFEEPYRSHYTFNAEDNILQLSGQRLATYIWNNYKRSIYTKKYYSKNNRSRHSNIFMTTDCPLTGVCYDMAILNPIYDFLAKPNSSDFTELLEDCLSSICKDVQVELQYRYTATALTEDIQSNEYEFTKDGKLA